MSRIALEDKKQYHSLNNQKLTLKYLFTLLLFLWVVPCFAQTFSSVDHYSGMPEMFTEEYQKDFIKAYLVVADKKDFVAGMHVYAFSDLEPAGHHPFQRYQ